MYNENNIFFKIIKKEISTNLIFENNFALSFHDINPLAKIHALVIPKGKFKNIIDFSSLASTEEKDGFFLAISEVISILNLQNDGFRIISNCGINGGQEIDHFHMHILGGQTLGKMVNK